MDIPSEDRDVIIDMMVNVYAKMGYNDKAKELAKKQNSIVMSRELLMCKATAAEERDKCYGEAIITLLTQLKDVMWCSVSTKVSLFTTPTGSELFISLAHLYESIFSDGRCGTAHLQIRDLYLSAAIRTARQSNTEKAFEYFKKAFEHKKLYDSIRCTGEYQYTSPLVAKVTFPSANFPPLPSTFWKGWIKVLPEEFKERIKSDSAYAECFE